MERLQRSIFYNEFLQPFGDDSVHCVGGSLQPPGGSVAIGFHRPLHAEAFDEGQIRILNPLVSHLTRLFEVRAALSTASRRLQLTEAALDSNANAIFVVDAAGKPLLMNRQAQALLMNDEVLRLTAAGLRARDEPTSQELVTAFTMACGRTQAAGGVLAAPRRAGPPLRIVVTPWVFGGVTRALVVVHDPARHDELLLAKLRALYGLTAGEATTAVNLSRGLSPAEAAHDRNLALPTIRSQIRQVLAKMEARGIPELVSLVATMPAEG